MCHVQSCLLSPFTCTQSHGGWRLSGLRRVKDGPDPTPPNTRRHCPVKGGGRDPEIYNSRVGRTLLFTSLSLFLGGGWSLGQPRLSRPLPIPPSALPPPGSSSPGSLPFLCGLGWTHPPPAQSLRGGESLRPARGQ